VCARVRGNAVSVYSQMYNSTSHDLILSLLYPPPHTPRLLLLLSQCCAISSVVIAKQIKKKERKKRRRKKKDNWEASDDVIRLFSVFIMLQHFCSHKK